MFFFSNFKLWKLYNPATGQEEYAGYARDKAGNLLYDDKAVAVAIEKGESFEDAFGNTYEPVKSRGKVRGYHVKDGSRGKYLKIINGDNKVMYTKVQAQRQTVGKSYKESDGNVR